MDQVRSTREDCRSVGLNFACFILVGFPGETDDDRQKTLEFVKWLHPDFLVLNHYIPVPNSWAYQEMKENHDVTMDSNFMLHHKPSMKKNLDQWINKIHRAWRS